MIGKNVEKKSVFYTYFVSIFSSSRENLLRSLRSVFPLCDSKMKFTHTTQTWIVLVFAASGSSAAILRKFLLKYEISDEKIYAYSIH